MLTLPTAVAICVVVAVGSAVQRISGMGVGIVASPILVLTLGPAMGVTFTNILGVCAALIIGTALWRDADWGRLKVILPASILGSVPAAFFVLAVPTAWLNIVVGALVVLALSTTAIVSRLGRLPEVDGVAARVATGAVGAFLNGTAGVAATATVIYSAFSRWDQRSFAASMQPTFFVMGILSVSAKIAVGATPLSAFPPAWFLGVVLAVILASVWVAGRLAYRVSPGSARRLAVVVAAIGAVATLLRGILQLFS